MQTQCEQSPTFTNTHIATIITLCFSRRILHLLEVLDKIVFVFPYSYDVMLQCWQEDPDKRPAFHDLKMTFENVLLEASSYISFSSLTEETPLKPRYMYIHCA